MQKPVPEHLYRGELVAYPGPWAFDVGKRWIILVADEELVALSDPDRRLNLSLTTEPQVTSLRQICEEGRRVGARTLILAFDHFFAQYRPGQHKPRRLMPDSDAYIRRVAAISSFAQRYGLGLELSLLSPLEVGPAYRRATGESGLWLHYREGLRDPSTGLFSVQLWRQLSWANNKGIVNLEDAGIRAFAFRESPIPGTPYRVVDPAQIVEIHGRFTVARMPGTAGGTGDYRAERVIIGGHGGNSRARGLDRILVVQQYRSPEMDYFSPKALPFLKRLIDRYHAAGVRLNALYSDEMHIQQDWHYFHHHDNGAFAMRYASPGFAARFAMEYGDKHRDFAKYLVYFAWGQEDFVNDLSARSGAMHVFAGTVEGIHRTALFRSRYYRLLQDGVVDLFTKARRHAERKAGYRLESRAHATWAESPTCDCVNSGLENHYKYLYEYTSAFTWSNTVQQASSACADFFKWGDFLTGNGNDHAECGWADRDYLGLSLAASTGILNEVPYSYGAHWGFPDSLARRRQALVDASGASASQPFKVVQDAQHRDVDVLFLYPLDLVSVEERFGSWMTQYSNCNYITAPILAERGRVKKGAIEVAGRRFTTLVAMFEPFPSKKLVAMMRRFAAAGGRLVWSGPAPLLYSDGSSALAEWQDLFGIEHTPDLASGLLAPGQEVRFRGKFAGIPTQLILTDFIVDRIHPLIPRGGTATVATVKDRIVGTHRVLKGGGTATCLGFRPRDDQSASLGYETKTWFEILLRLGAYPATGRFREVNDNTDFISRTSDFLACRFPNGATAMAPHFRRVEEEWAGGFARDKKADGEYLRRNPPPPENFRISDFRINGHTIDYSGSGAMAFRSGSDGRLIAFAGRDCREITVDGKRTVFATKKVKEAAWAPVNEARKLANGAIVQIRFAGAEKIMIPWRQTCKVEVVAEGGAPGSRGMAIRHAFVAGAIELTIPRSCQGKWLYICARPA